MLLPRMLRESVPNVSIGFFLHIPFPSFEIFRLLPPRWRQGILEGLLGSDLIGLHTYDYMRHFLQSVLRILGYEHQMGEIHLPDHIVEVETYPMGIDFDRFHSAACHEETFREREELKRILPDARVVLSVDRLDYTKGILNRLEGYELFLDRHPEWRGKVVLVMVVVPSRIGVDHYEFMKKQIEETVGRIEGKYGTLGWSPLLYRFRHLPFHTLVALYSMSDVALITPLRDGMNLIAKEYIASRHELSGVLILSEMAGAAKEMGEALIINPNDKSEISEALFEALRMPLEEQVRRNKILQLRLRRYNVVRWAGDFLDQLAEMGHVQERYGAKLLSPEVLSRLVERYRTSGRRLLLLDYDGTLMPLAIRPDLVPPSAAVLELLSRLASDPRNTVIVISGRDKGTLDSWLGALPVGLVAEHGFWKREPRGEWQSFDHRPPEWKQRLLPLLEKYADRLPGAYVEEKDNSIVWHYRPADPEQAQMVAMELSDDLIHLTANIDLQVLRGSKNIEIRNVGMNKGVAVAGLIASGEYDFILAMGDDWTDEDLFAAVPESAFSIRVGITTTLARFSVKVQQDVLELLTGLAETPSPVRTRE
jgi:trehalose 6-phosphate synthase/phosphatase